MEIKRIRKFVAAKIRGRHIEDIAGSPRFDTRAEAEQWATQYAKDHPDEFPRGQVSFGAREDRMRGQPLAENLDGMTEARNASVKVHIDKNFDGRREKDE